MIASRVRPLRGSSVRLLIGIARAAAPHMIELMQQTQEGVILGVLDGTEVVYCHLVETPQAVRVHTRVGDRIPAHCTSTGLALLAELDDATLAALLPATLPPFSPHTITSRAALLRELARPAATTGARTPPRHHVGARPPSPAGLLQASASSSSTCRSSSSS